MPDDPLTAEPDLVRAFLDHSPAVAWLKDEAGRYVYVSRRYEELVGRRDGGWLGRTDDEVWPGPIARRFRDNDRDVLATGRALGVVESFPRPDGSETRWWVVKFPFADSAGGKYVGGVGVEVGGPVGAEPAAGPGPSEGPLVTMCAWTRRVWLGGEWVTVEEFLRERFGLVVTHGISEEVARRYLAELKHRGAGG